MPAVVILTLAIVPAAIVVVALGAWLVSRNRKATAHRHTVERHGSGIPRGGPMPYTTSDVEEPRRLWLHSPAYWHGGQRG
jgi:hypothetical protein